MTEVAPVTEVTEKTVNDEILKINGIIDSNGIKIDAIKKIIDELYSNSNILSISEQTRKDELLQNKQASEQAKADFEKINSELDSTIITLQADITNLKTLSETETKELKDKVDEITKEKNVIEQVSTGLFKQNNDFEGIITNLKEEIKQYKSSIQKINNTLLTTTENKLNQEKQELERIVSQPSNINIKALGSIEKPTTQGNTGVRINVNNTAHDTDTNNEIEDTPNEIESQQKKGGKTKRRNMRFKKGKKTKKRNRRNKRSR